MVGEHKRKYVRIRAVDVGRSKHHYIKIGVLRTGKTERIGGLRKYKNPSTNKGEEKKDWKERAKVVWWTKKGELKEVPLKEYEKREKFLRRFAKYTF